MRKASPAASKLRLTAEQRARIGAAAVETARSVGYTSDWLLETTEGIPPLSVSPNPDGTVTVPDGSFSAVASADDATGQPQDFPTARPPGWSRPPRSSRSAATG